MATPNPFDQFDHMASQPTMAGSSPAGLLAPGNIDLSHRPVVRNADGTISTVRSMSANFDGREVLLPTISDDGRILSDDEAIDLYRRTGRNLGSFDTPEHATAYAQNLHEQQASYYGAQDAGAGTNPFDQFDHLTGPTHNANRVLNGAGNRTSANDSAFARMITDQPAPEPQVQEGNALTRALGELGGRQVLQGAYGLYGSLGGDALDHYVLSPIDRALDTEGTALQLGTGGKGYRQAASELADRLGMRRPETASERVVSDVGEALTGTAATMGLGGLVREGGNVLAGAAPGIRNRLAELLLSQPGAQAISTATGAAAGGATREAGGGAGLQMLAGVAGGLAPGAATSVLPGVTGGALRAQGAVPTLAAGATRRALRGRDVKAVSDRVEQFAAANTNPSVGQATGSRSAQTLESYLAKSPGSAGRMAALADQQAQGARQLTDDLSDSIATRGADLTPTQVGASVQKGIYGPDGFVDRTKAVSDRLYGEVERHLPPQSPVQVNNTRAALRALNSSVDGAPAVSRFFQNARIQGIEQGLLEDTTGGAALLTQPGVHADVEAYRQYLQAQAQEATQRNAQRRMLGMTNFEPVSTPAQIEQNVRTTLGNMADGSLPYEALQKLRTLVGHEVDGALFSGDGRKAKWDALYSAMTKDMEAAAVTPQAKQAWQRANNYYRMRMQRLGHIEDIVNKNGGPEAAYQSMFSGARNGATPLKRVMDALQPKSRAEVAAAFLQRMGRATKGNQDATADAFSMQTFLSNWADLSPEARKQLFSNARFGSDYVANVDKLAQMAGAIKEGGKAFANPSGSGGQVALGATIGGTGVFAAQQLMSGNLSGAAMAIGSGLAYVGANNATARLMTSPRVVKWLAHHTQRDTGDTLGTLMSIQALRQIGREEDMPEAEQVADQLERQYRSAKGIPARRAQ